MKIESPQDRLATIKRLVDEDLRTHRVTPLVSADAAKVWCCAAPNTWINGFYVTVIPGHVMIAGDIGEIIFRPTHRKTIDFVLDTNDIHYQLGKAVEEFRACREISPYLVRACLHELVMEYRSIGRPLDPAFKSLCRTLRAENYQPEDSAEFLGQLMDAGIDAVDLPVITVPAHSIIYRTFALQWFGHALKACMEKAA